MKKIRKRKRKKILGNGKYFFRTKRRTEKGDKIKTDVEHRKNAEERNTAEEKDQKKQHATETKNREVSRQEMKS